MTSRRRRQNRYRVIWWNHDARAIVAGLAILVVGVTTCTAAGLLFGDVALAVGIAFWGVLLMLWMIWLGWGNW